MKHCVVLAAILLSLSADSVLLADEPVFSGPQIGEKLPPFTVRSVLGKSAGRPVDLIKEADGKPVLLVFFHAKTRPAFGLTNLLMRFAATKEPGELYSAVIFLTDDATPMKQWIKVVQKNFVPKTTIYGISPDGLEGPGSYGLNRNVTLTVLVGSDGKVTGNFALVQPGIQVDGPKILKAVVDATGGGEVPTLASLGAGKYGEGEPGRMMKRTSRRGQENDPQLGQLLRAVVRNDVTAEDVKASVADVEEYVAENKDARHELGYLTSQVVSSDRMSSFPEHAQRALKMWAQKYGAASDDDRQKATDDKDDGEKAN